MTGFLFFCDYQMCYILPIETIKSGHEMGAMLISV